MYKVFSDRGGEYFRSEKIEHVDDVARLFKSLKAEGYTPAVCCLQSNEVHAALIFSDEHFYRYGLASNKMSIDLQDAFDRFNIPHRGYETH